MSDLHLDAYNFPQITTATSLFIDIGVGTSREVEGGSKSLVSLCGNRNPTPLPNFLCFFFTPPGLRNRIPHLVLSLEEKCQF